MKKVLAILSIVALTSCGSEATSNEVVVDSSAVAVDSVKLDSAVMVVDSTVGKIEEAK